MKKLDDLLNEIAKEPYDSSLSENEIVFLRRLTTLRRLDYVLFARYLHAYNEVRNAKLME